MATYKENFSIKGGPDGSVSKEQSVDFPLSVTVNALSIKTSSGCAGRDHQINLICRKDSVTKSILSDETFRDCELFSKGLNPSIRLNRGNWTISLQALGFSPDEVIEGELTISYSIALFTLEEPSEQREEIMSKGPGKKVYRRAIDGPAVRDAERATTIVLTELTCNTTEDNAGADECELRIWADNNYQSHRKDMDNGDSWNLNIRLTFSYRIKIELWDLDNPGFPLYDDHDHLGTVIINPDQPQGSGSFTQDGADYRIDWIPG